MLSGIIYIQFIFTLAFRSGAWYNIFVTIFRAQSETKAIFVYMRRKDTMARVVGISAAVMLIIAAAAVVALHLWKHNNLLSIFGGTVLYMVLVQAVFV